MSDPAQPVACERPGGDEVSKALAVVVDSCPEHERAIVASQVGEWDVLMGSTSVRSISSRFQTPDSPWLGRSKDHASRMRCCPRAASAANSDWIVGSHASLSA